jgi:hypothetical protein
MQSGVQKMRNHEIFPEIPLTTIPGNSIIFPSVKNILNKEKHAVFL